LIVSFVAAPESCPRRINIRLRELSLALLDYNQNSCF